jgi:membrane associated rhomboid family serine protease
MHKNKQNVTIGVKFNWIAAKLLLIITFVFLLQTISPQTFEIFVLKRSEILFRPWTFVTYIFLHGSFLHLFSNMLSLFIFGSILEKVVGYKNFLKVFFFTGIFSGVVSTFFYSSVIGASGAIFGVMGVLALIRPKMVVWAFGVPMYIIVAIIIYASLDLAGVFYPDDIAHLGHLSALILGILIGLAWKKKYQVFEKKKKEFVLSEEEFQKWEDKYMKKPSK